MAQQSIVLLKNENNTLPLKKSIKKIAVIGPNADNKIAVLGNYNGIPSEIVTALEGIKRKLGDKTEIVYEQAINFTNDTLLVYSDVSKQYSFEGKQGFKAAYFTDTALKGNPVIRSEDNIDHFWQEGQEVIENIRANNFAARYSTNFKATEDGYIMFEVEADDGYRFLVNNNLVINSWLRNRWGARTYRLDTKKDSVYHLTLEYWQGEGKGNVKLRAGTYAKTNFSSIANKVKDADAIIYVGGISPQLEGEEMRVDYPGFNGGDRTSILLPSVQTELMKTLKSTGKPIVFVMMTGSAIATPWETENIPAIVNAWYGGQSAGTAIADVLFSDYNPSGRLPVTFYKHDSDLPDFNDYSMTNRTYRYFEGDALYPFGYGLSYTNFKYEKINLSANAKQQANIPVSVSIKNTGDKDGEEVVQLYIQWKDQSIKTPVRSLKGFQRIFLKAGESKTVHFTLTAAELSMATGEQEIFYPKGQLEISIGGGQPHQKIKQHQT